MAPKISKKQLQPFGGINAQAKLGQMREEALRTRSRQECFELGYLTVQDLDDEELRYGRCRDEYGQIPKNGKKTELIPLELYDKMIKEHELRFNQRLRQNLDTMLDIMLDIATDDTVEPKDRLDAAKYLMERTIGKTPDKVQVTVNQKPWEEMLTQVTGIAPMTRAQHRELQQNGEPAGIVEAEVVDDEEQTQDKPGDETARTIFDETDSSENNVKLDEHDGDREPEPDHGSPRTAGGETATSDKFATRGTIDGGDYVVNNEKESLADVGYHEEGSVPSGTYDTYGHRKAEAKSYAEQVRAAADLAKRRKEAREKRRQAVKQRKIARAMGSDAIKDEITGASVDDDGQITFN